MKNGEQNCHVDMNLSSIGITQSCSVLGIKYGLFYVYCFYVQNQHEKLGLTVFLKLWGCRADGTIENPEPFSSHFLQNASYKDFCNHREEENLILLIENENPLRIYKPWQGSGCSLHDMEKYMGQGLKTQSLLSIMLHTEKGPRHARDSLYWIQMSPKQQVYSVKLPRQHQLLMKSWGERGEEGYMFRHIFTVILQTSLFPKKSKMKADCL